MYTSRLCLRGRPSLGTAVSCLCLLSLLLFLAACSTQSATVAEPTVAEPTLPPPTETAAPTEVPTTQPLAERLDAFMTQKADENRFKGAVLVARGDEIIFANAYGMADEENQISNTLETKFRILNLTIPFTSMAIMQLYERGLLDVNDPICNYLDDCPEAWADVTIHHLLTCTSGVPSYMMVPGWLKIAETPTPPEQLLTPVKEKALDHRPGSEVGPTCESGCAVLGQIIESVSGQSYADFLQTNIFDPLGMADTGLDEAPEGLALGYITGSVPADRVAAANLYAWAGLHSTVGDLNRFAQALDSEQLISKPTTNLMFGEHLPFDTSHGVSYGWLYGYLENHPEHPDVAMFGTLAGFDTFFNRYPEDDLTVIVLSNLETAGAFGVMQGLSEIVFYPEGKT